MLNELNELLPFNLELNPTAIAATSLWSLALYLGFSSIGEWVTRQLTRWFNFAEQSLYLSKEEFERTRSARESQNAFYASVFSIIPFLIVGGLCSFGVEATLGRSWDIGIGILACMSCGIYELGRRAGRSSE
ncbi:MAG: hypothetical protein HC866_11445 [Leptolyngbyaceae cyanobacterium RU_5_1]|nr:hypothetical protein [Leptolyngbyaceae cyanobacterium RU_5_1]